MSRFMTMTVGNPVRSCTVGRVARAGRSQSAGSDRSADYHSGGDLDSATTLTNRRTFKLVTSPGSTFRSR